MRPTTHQAIEVDAQGVLGTGTADRVAAVARLRVPDQSAGAGLVLGSVHRNPASVPPGSLVGPWRAAWAGA